MKKLLAVAVLFTAFSFTSLDANAEMRREPFSDFISDPCLPTFMNTYYANVDDYGESMAGSMAIAAWNSCHDSLGN